MGATTSYGFCNIDAGKQIVVVEKRVFAGISRANQTISIYHGETLIADCTMPSAGMENFPTVVSEELTLHDDTFTGFIDGETYTIVAGGEPSITGFVMNGLFLSFDVSVLWGIFHYAGQNIALDVSASRTNYAISQKITTTKKRYDIKRLPEELLPKTVATKAEVQTSANAAQSTANAAQSTANAAQSTANAAQSTANAAQSTAKSLSAEVARCANGLFVNPGSNIPGEMYTNFVVLHAGNRNDAVSGENISGINLYVSDGSLVGVNTKALIYIQPPSARDDFPMIRFRAIANRAVRHLTGVELADISAITINSSTPNSTKKFRITVNDSGTLSAAEVTDAS